MALYNLPDLPYDYAALEPAITGEILELHHSKHHAAYVKGANDTLEKTTPSASPATSCTPSSGRTSPRTAATAPTAPWPTPSTSTSAATRPSRSS